MSSKSIALIALLLLVGGAAWAFRSSVDSDPPTVKNPNLVLVTAGSNDYWQMIAKGAEQAAGDLGVKVEVRMPERVEDLDSQLKILDNLNYDSIDGLILSPIDAEAQTRSIDRYCNNTLVFTIDSDAPFSSRLVYVGTSNLAAGQKSGQLAKEALPDGGSIAVLMANMTKDNMLERKEGFESELATSGGEEAGESQRYQVVDYLSDDGDDERCKQQIRKLLGENPDLGCIVGLAARHGPILLELLAEEESLSKVKLITFDAPDQTLEGIASEKIFATVAQDPFEYGYEAVQLLSSFCNREANQMPPPGLYSTMNIATKVVRQANVEEFRETLKTRAGDKSERDLEEKSE